MELANLGSADRIIRLIAGIALIVIPLVMGMSLSTLPGLAMVIVGAILTVTAIVKFCPLYKIIGFKTNGSKKV